MVVLPSFGSAEVNPNTFDLWSMKMMSAVTLMERTASVKRENGKSCTWRITLSIIFSLRPGSAASCAAVAEEPMSRPCRARPGATIRLP